MLGEFLLRIYKKNTLLSGFLSVISNLPKFMGKDDDELKSIEFMKTSFFFKTVKNVIIVLGINSTNESKNVEIQSFQILGIIKNFIENEIEIEKIEGLRSEESIKLRHNIEHKLLKDILSFDFSENDLDYEDHCPLCMKVLSAEVEFNNKADLWDLLEDRMKK